MSYELYFARLPRACQRAASFARNRAPMALRVFVAPATETEWTVFRTEAIWRVRAKIVKLQSLGMLRCECDLWYNTINFCEIRFSTTVTKNKERK